MSVMTRSIEGITERDIAKAIDHSLLRPELDDEFVEAGCRLAAEYDVASVCVRPADVRRARAILDGRYAVSIDDIRKLAGPVLVHRVVRNFHAEADGMRARDLIATIVDQVAS